MKRKNNRNRGILIRCSEAENRNIKELSRKHHQTKSAYIRNCALHGRPSKQPIEVLDALRELNHLNRKIGNNINQVVKASHARGFVGTEDIEALTRLLTKLDASYEKIYQEIRGKKDGGHKTAADEGTEKRKSLGTPEA